VGRDGEQDREKEAGIRRIGRVAWPSSCSRNAHDQNVLVRRAQSRIDQAALENEMGNGKTRVVEDESAPIPVERTSQPGRIIYTSFNRLK
jgi:hypothetical protein